MWILTYSDYDACNLIGIFTTEQRALEYKAVLENEGTYKGKLDVEEAGIDPQLPVACIAALVSVFKEESFGHFVIHGKPRMQLVPQGYLDTTCSTYTFRVCRSNERDVSAVAQSIYEEIEAGKLCGEEHAEEALAVINKYNRCNGDAQ